MCSYKIRFLWYDEIFVVIFTVVILNAALAVLSDKGQCVCVCVCVCVWGGGGLVVKWFGSWVRDPWVMSSSLTTRR